ncbi:voltage-dependent T-type calcium channel subunit alpha-1H-like [Conger conger]|uniref:voltage-dependent T-type calcium channel subunit alpha-1H-like n=1 Tax=Conger conger TaxID=82655 RepID=UPI002A5A188B|nr:voltage-dependent T-type calcium channel subunit alpha-1H-like [Conger conger]
MSPPCISVDPPLEAELCAPAPPPPLTERATLLRRRTPSCDSAHQRDSLDQQDQQPLIEPADERLPVPQFSFDQSDLSSLSSMSEVLSDSDQSMHSLDARPEGGAKAQPIKDLEGGVRAGLPVAASPLRKRGLMRVSCESHSSDSVV